MWNEAKLPQLSQMRSVKIYQQLAYPQTIKGLSQGQKELPADSLNQEAKRCLLI